MGNVLFSVFWLLQSVSSCRVHYASVRMRKHMDKKPYRRHFVFTFPEGKGRVFAFITVRQTGCLTVIKAKTRPGIEARQGVASVCHAAPSDSNKDKDGYHVTMTQ